MNQSFVVRLLTLTCCVSLACSAPRDSTPPRSAIDAAVALAAPHPQLALVLAPSREGWALADGQLVSPGWRSAEGDDLGARLQGLGNSPLELSLGQSEDKRVRLTPLDAAAVTATLHEGRVGFREVYRSTDVVLAATGARFEQFFVLRDEKAPGRFSWALELGKALRAPRLEPGGEVAFNGLRDEAVFRMPRPFAVDAKGVRREGSLVLAEGRLDLVLDTEGLAFPVLLDPVLEVAVWTQLFPAAPPSVRQRFHLVFDTSRNVGVLFGGDTTGPTNQGDTWEWNGSTWTLKCSTCVISARRQYAAAFDSGRNVTVVVGGVDTGLVRDTWEWNGTAWAQKCAACGPTARTGAAMAYDPARGVSVLFSGGNAAVNDTWSWNGTAWTQVCTGACQTAGPLARRDAAMVFDASRGVAVLFGGVLTGTGVLTNETWEWNGTAWTQRTPATPPPARSNHRMVYDSVSRKVMLFGGVIVGPVAVADTWQWDGTTWTQINGAGPAARADFGLTYDPARKQVVLFGGTLVPGLVQDTWVYRTHGGACVGGGDCDTGNCVDGVCCETASCATCQSCNLTNPGVCTNVAALTSDAPGCASPAQCNGSGTCLLGPGTACTAPAQCASNFCKDGVCCGSACTTACQTCSATPGTCTTVTSADDTPECNGLNTCSAAGACLKKPGQVCGVGTECASGNCVDGYCCNTGCGAPCLTCSATPGTCMPVLGFDDNPQCNNTNTCDAVGACKLKLGFPCGAGTQCASGLCVDGVCCNGACAGGCDVCNSSTTPGTCAPVAASSPGANPGCGLFLCDGLSGTCPGTCTNDLGCATTAYCAANGTCQARKSSGSVCNTAATADCLVGGCRSCTSGNCVDGVCCGAPCNLPCQTCSATPGTCTPVVNADDVTQCTGTNTCDGASQCKKKQAQGCGAASECATNQCADGVCCDTSCAGGCDLCNLGGTVGTCTKLPAGNAGVNPACTPLVCSGTSGTCPGGCTSDGDCLATAYCAASGQCLPRKARGTSCDTGAGQDCMQGNCRACAMGACSDGFCCDTACGGSCDVCAAALGATANGTCTVAPAGFVGSPSCMPRLCDGAAAACPGGCTSDTGCGASSYCDSTGQCVPRKTQGAQCNDGAGADCLASGCRVCATAACKDGFCCDTTCGVACQSCSATPGTCSPLAGADDQPECTGTNTCDSAAACRKKPGQACAVPAECASGQCVNSVCYGGPLPTCPADLTLEATGVTGATATFTVTAQDLADPNPTVVSVPPSGSVFPLGTTSVTATATNQANQSNQCTFRVIVRDTTLPAVTCPEAQVAESMDTSGAVVSYAPATATDLADAMPVLDYSHPSGSTFPRGKTTVIVSATDASNNRATCEFQVDVQCAGVACGELPPDEKPRSHFGFGFGCSSSGQGAPVLPLALLLGLLLLRGRRARATVLASCLVALAPLSAGAKPKKAAAKTVAPAVAPAAPPPVEAPPPAPVVVQEVVKPAPPPDPAPAPAAPSPGRKLKLAYVGVNAGAGIEEKDAKTVTDYIQGELVGLGVYDVISQSDLQAMLGHERQKQLLGCTDGCSTELAGALDSDRVLTGSLSRLEGSLVFSLSLIDVKAGPIAHATRRIEDGSFGRLLDELRPAVYELVNKEKFLEQKPLAPPRGFGGLVVGLGVDADLLSLGFAPSVMAELSGRWFGGAVSILVKQVPGLRLQARFYPVVLGPIRLYVAAGVVAFPSGLGGQVGAGAALRVASLRIYLDASYARFYNLNPAYSPNSVVLGAGVGWNF